MDGENSASDENSSPVYKSKENSDKHHAVNGISNGYSDNNKHKSHKSSSDHKDKHRDKDREKDHHHRDKSKSKDHKSSSRDKDRHSSSKDKDKHSSSSHKSSSSSNKDKEKHRDKDRHKDKSRDKDRDNKEKEHKSKDKDREKDKDRREREKDKEKDKDRHKSSSSSSKDKEKHRDRDRHREKDGKDRHHSSSRSKDKDKDRKEKENRDKRSSDQKYESKRVKSLSDSSKEDSVDEDDQKLVIKEEVDSQNSDDHKLVIKEENSDDQNISQASSCDYNISQFKDESKFDGYDDDDDDDDADYKDNSELKTTVKDENDYAEENEAPAEEDEDSEDDDIPIAKRIPSKRKMEDSEGDEDDMPLGKRKKAKKEKKSSSKKRSKRQRDYDEDEEEEEEEEEDEKPIKREKKSSSKTKAKVKVEVKREDGAAPKKRKKKDEEEQEVWKWWEEDKRQDGAKWTYLEHKGPVFAPPYERLPKDVKFFYDGDEMRLSEETEEVAGFYAKMLDHDYTTKDVFNNNFFKDWRKVMTDKERAKITNLNKCNFKQMHAYFMDLAEKNRNRTKEEKLALKEKNEAILKEYGFCTIDGHREKIGNFKIEPPGLFRGRGEHPKMGMLKRRVQPEDVLINCSKDSKIPVAPEGRKWKEVRHDCGVTWLASWTENVQNQVKYVMLNPSSKLKGEKDWQKYETARRLHKCIDKIRKEYQSDWKSKEMRIRQRAVALYFIDKLALRAGNEKDEDQADTVGCCSLRVEHIQLLEHKDDKDYVVVFDFLGKDSIRYYNEVPVEKRVFKNLQLFMENKSTGDDLFDRLNTTVMNKHLNELMEGLTAKVFRTYNASITLQQQLEKLTNPDDSVTEKILAYNRANRAVAILCNHQRSVPKSHQKSMDKLKEKITSKKDAISDAERQVKDAQRDAKRGSVKEKVVLDKKKKMLQRLKEQLLKLEVQETDRDENKTIALGTSKLNYLDPRISVAWCKKYDVPIDKIYNKTQRDKFRWAIDMAGPEYVF